MPQITTDVTKAAKDLATVAKDATYVLIGAGVLGVQRVQVHRHELRKRFADPTSGIGDRVAGVRSDLNDRLGTVDTRVEALADRLEEIIGRIETSFAPIEDRLPAPARDAVRQARVQAREARSQLRTFIPTVAA